MLNSLILSLEASPRQSITNLSLYLSFGVGTDSHLLYDGRKVLSLFYVTKQSTLIMANNISNPKEKSTVTWN